MPENGFEVIPWSVPDIKRSVCVADTLALTDAVWSSYTHGGTAVIDSGRNVTVHSGDFQA